MATSSSSSSGVPEKLTMKGPNSIWRTKFTPRFFKVPKEEEPLPSQAPKIKYKDLDEVDDFTRGHVMALWETEYTVERIGKRMGMSMELVEDLLNKTLQEHFLTWKEVQMERIQNTPAEPIRGDSF